MSEETIREALSYIDPTDRDVWIRCCFSIKSELGDAGFEIWDEWSRGASSYRESSARSTWKHAKREGRVTIASLYALAKANGWKGEGRSERPAVDPRRIQRERDDEAKRHQRAKRDALALIQRSTVTAHPYLVRKGFPEEQGLVADGLLVIPMRDVVSYELQSVQTITAEGHKKFLAGGKAKGAVYVLGAGSEPYLVEGYATGLSVRAALAHLHRREKVVVCFSAANLAFVAQRFRRGLVIADHDESGTGERYAEKSGLPWWMPPEFGDANDFMLAHGVRALAECLNELRRSVQGGSRQGRKTQTGRPQATAVG